MKRILSVILSLVIGTLASVIPFSAATYKPAGSSTVSADTPTCEEAIEACGGNLNDVQRICFRLPAEDPEHPEDHWTNHYNSDDLGIDYCQACVYWWQGIGSEWPDGTKVQWPGYKTKLIDAENRIYEASIPLSEDTTAIIWNNGVNGGADSTQEISSYAHMLKAAYVKGAEPGEYDTLPEGSPDRDTMDGCIQIVSSDERATAELSNLHSFDWYIYYGDGCYGSYPESSENYRGRYASCLNPEHDHTSLVYLRGDADNDSKVTIIDATVIQKKLASIKVRSFNEKAADIDGKGLDITDATKIQRYLAGYADPDHIGEPFSDETTPEEEPALPSKVDMRDYNGRNYVTRVKSQKFGDCWSFSLAGAAEIAYLFANNMGVPAGEINDNVDFSEKYIVWYMFHGISEDDVITGRVRASQVGEGFDLSEADSERELTAYFIGGPFVHDANLFGAGFGPVDESIELNGEYPYAYDDEWDGEWTLPLNALYRSAPAGASLRCSRILSSPAAIDENKSYSFNEEGLEGIKSEIFKGHGVSLALNASSGYNAENKAVYHGRVTTPNHAVVAVGYDDDYPKENFTRYNARGIATEGSTPPENGAFIIKNSWGISESEEDGYFYLSYYDQSITTPLSYEFDSEKSLRHTEVNFDQYDLMMTNWYGSTQYDTETKIANVFDAEEDENLYQIEYRTSAPDTEVSYEIYKDVESDDPSSGILLETGTYRHTYPGFYKIDLDHEYTLKKGENYAVVLTMRRLSDNGKTMVYTEVFPYSTEFFEGMSVKGIVNKSESYLYTGGKWHDMADMKDSLTERAYQYCEEQLRIDPSLPKIKLNGKENMAIDNYPIKAISAPAGKS